MNGLQAVIFDMDGVIVDSEPHHERAFLEVMRALGYTGAHGLRFSEYVGRSDQQLWRISLRGTNPSRRSRSWPR